MINLNKIGLETDQATELTEKLSDLLANYHIFFQNLRGFHWNIKGENFFQLHEKFEELYTNAFENIDEIAERILTLGAIPVHSYSEYLKISQIEEITNCFDSTGTLKAIINNLSQLIIKERQILRLAEEAQDDATADLMTEYIKTQEKTIWMLSAYLNK
jgi:starvation-inducible DNA-binding protein